MSKIVATVAVLMLAFAATASAQTAQDYRSPDAKGASAQQDYRSPDAKGASAQQDYRSPDARSVQNEPSVQDLRSPDARGSGRFQPPVPTASARTSDPFAWGYMALAIAVALASLAGFVIVQRRRRHGLAIGS